MTNYEKAKYLLKKGIARKHYTYDFSEYIMLDLGGEYVGYISPYSKYVQVANGCIHYSYGDIDLQNMMVLDSANRRKYNRPIKKWGAE